MSKKFPIDTIFESITAVSGLITKALPDDELKKKKFDEGQKLRNQKQLFKLLNRSVGYFAKHKLTAEDVDEYVRLIGISDSEFSELLKARLEKRK